MGRGLGKVQREIIDMLTTKKDFWVPFHEIYQSLYGENLHWNSDFKNKSRAQAFYRAIRKLKKRSLIEVKPHSKIIMTEKTEFWETQMLAEIALIRRPSQVKFARILQTKSTL